MQGVSSGKMAKLIVALQTVDALGVGIAGNKTDVLLHTLHEMLPADDIELISRFFTFPGQDVLMTDANCIKLKLFMAIGMINFIFKARFTIILRGGFAVRMNILKKKQTVDSFKATKDMNDLLDTVSNADLDCLVMPVHGNDLSEEDQGRLIRLLQMSIEKTAESFMKKHSETLLPKIDDVRKYELESMKKRMQTISMRRDDIKGEDADSQTQKQYLNDHLQKLQNSITALTLSAAVAKPDHFGLTIRPATRSALTTKINWKIGGSQVEIMDVTVVLVHDAGSLYADASRMKQIQKKNALWCYPGEDILLIEYLNVMHNIGQQIQQISSDSEMPPADKDQQLKLQYKLFDKFKSRAKICYGLTNDEERGALPQNLMGEVHMMLAGGSKSKSKSKSSKKRTRRVRRTKKRNGRKTRNGRKICQ